jgi:septal ring factor EnvC (AmiA/AmiB activator)
MTKNCIGRCLNKLPLVIAACLIFSNAADAAANQTAGASPQAKLQETQSALKSSKQHYARLQADSQKLEQELAEIQKQILKTSQSGEQHEKRLLELEQQEAKLGLLVAAAQDDLTAHRAEISGLMGSVIRLSRIPPEAVIALPGKLHQTMQAASLLQSTTKQLQAQTQELSTKLRALERDKEALKENREAAAKEAKHFTKNQEILNQQLASRKKFYDALDQQQKQEQQKIATLTRESHSMQQLLERLEKERRAAEQARALAAAKARQAAKRAEEQRLARLRLENKQVTTSSPSRAPSEPITTRKIQSDKRFASFIAARGKLGMPVVGRVAARFGQKLGQNQTSRGVTILSRAGNSVRAPYAGEVVFTGPFLDYGRMVILRYDSGYHLLLAGLSQINCRVGQRVVAGEPLGQLGGNAGKSSNSLYLELRHGGVPINPAPWFG